MSLDLLVISYYKIYIQCKNSKLLVIFHVCEAYLLKVEQHSYALLHNVMSSM